MVHVILYSNDFDIFPDLPESQSNSFVVRSADFITTLAGVMRNSSKEDIHQVGNIIFKVFHIFWYFYIHIACKIYSVLLISLPK